MWDDLLARQLMIGWVQSDRDERKWMYWQAWPRIEGVPSMLKEPSEQMKSCKSKGIEIAEFTSSMRIVQMEMTTQHPHSLLLFPKGPSSRPSLLTIKVLIL